MTHKYGWGGEVQGGGAGQSSDIYYNYTGNRRNGFSYDAAGNLTNDLGQTFTYDATGQQATASYGGYLLQQVYDGDGLRVKKVENGATTLYLRSTVLGGQIVAEMNGSGGWTRGFVYLGSQLLAVQQAGVNWMHEDPVTKSKRVTNSAGTVVSTIETDPWGADTNRSSNVAFQPKKFTSYNRDSNGTDEAMFRRYNRWQSRFDQPDPYDGSYDFTDPQSFNRYAYVQGDPVNFTDPSGLLADPRSCGYYDHNDGYFHFAPCPGGGIDASVGGPNGPPGGYYGEPNPRGGGRDPQDSRIRQRVDDCTGFANTVAGTAASQGRNLRRFLDKLAQMFIGARNSSPLAMYQAQQHRLRAPVRYGSSGFQSQFVDPHERTANQVRHYVGGLIAGFNLGAAVGLRVMNSQETPGVQDFVPDTNLNGVSTRHGGDLRNRNPSDLANWIRRDVCTP